MVKMCKFILLIIFLAIPIIFLFVSNKKFYRYIVENWPSIVINVFITVITLAVAFRSFHLETDRVFQNERQTFKRNFNALLFETSKNYGAINSFTTMLNEQKGERITKMNLSKLDLDISQAILINSHLYKYAGMEMLMALQSYLVQTKITNRLLDIAYEEFLRQGWISAGMKNDIIGKLQSTKRYILILQLVNQYYIFGYGTKMGPSTPVKIDVDNWLKSDRTPSIGDLEEKLKQLSDFGKNDQDLLEKGLMKVELDN